jgi:hypothetical protein
MDAERIQNLEARLCEQVEATRATNELISQLFSMMRTRNVNENVATPPSPLVSLPLLATSTGRGVLHPSQPRSVLHSPRIKPASPDNFDSDRSKGCAFLTGLPRRTVTHTLGTLVLQVWCGEQCPSAFNSFELPSWMLYQDIQLLLDSGLMRGESGYLL